MLIKSIRRIPTIAFPRLLVCNNETRKAMKIAICLQNSVKLWVLV
jgi:hypothetical protein